MSYTPIVVAIIDDGVCDKILPSNINIRHYSVKDEIIQEKEYSVGKFTHGSICIKILLSVIPDLIPNIEIIDLNVFKSKRKLLQKLVAALKWCEKESISIINMSFGTLNYYEGKEIEYHIRKLIALNIHIVAAHDNRGLLAFPAGIKGVFSVRSGYFAGAQHGMIGYSSSNYMYPENCLIAYNNIEIVDNIIIDKNMNSYAAPIVTANIARILFDYPFANNQKIFYELTKNCNRKVLTSEISKVFNPHYNNIDIPVIALLIDNNIAIKENIVSYFSAEGYNAICICEDNDIKNGLPVSIFLNDYETINRELVETIIYIYDPEIIFFH